MIEHTKRILGKARPEDWKRGEDMVEEFNRYEECFDINFALALLEESNSRHCKISELPREIVLDIAVGIAWEYRQRRKMRRGRYF